jgi:hypothetical protein
MLMNPRLHDARLQQSRIVPKSKPRADWLILMLVLSGILFHTPLNIVGIALSLAILLIACFKHGLFVGRHQVLILGMFSACYFVQLFLPSEQLIYYATSGLLFIIAANSFTGQAGKSEAPLACAVAVFALFDFAVLIDPGKGEMLFGNPNAAAAIALTLFSYCVGYSNSLKLPRTLAFFALFAIAEVATESRGMLLFIGFASVVYIVARLYDRFALFAIVTGTAALCAWVAGDPIITGALDSLTGGAAPEFLGRDLFYFSGRDLLYQYVVQAVGFSWAGIGLGISNTLLQPWGIDMSPHNTFLRLYAEGGFLLLTAAIITFVLQITSIRNPILLALFAGALMRSIIESALPFGLSSQSLLIILPYLMSDLGPNFYRRHYVRLGTARR